MRAQKEGDPENVVVHSHSILIANIGRKPAMNVRVTHKISGKLPDLTIFPPTDYSIRTNPEGYSEIIFPMLYPKQQLIIAYVYFPPLLSSHIIGTVVSNEGTAQTMAQLPLKALPRPHFVSFIILTLVLIGAAFVLYWLFLWSVAWALSG
ncbi:hypothetical protein [Xanthomonas albilineans]|uniref:hypothetical protein n=1 Tax=Xanthomonas albilineans TaxID=29447 RepID=UPI0018B05763|nr:hypothetical protein [Xanthomonas albilineans]